MNRICFHLPHYAPGAVKPLLEDGDMFKVASWTRSYMQTLRVFGNESAHERDMATRVPATIDESDLALCLFCIQRVIEFYGAWRKPRGDA